MYQVLVVDDNESIRRGLAVLLRHEGFDVRAAADGAAALDAADAERPDAVLLDLSMPDVDGLTVLEELRERHGPGLPVVVYSAVEDEYVRRRAARLGARFAAKGTVGWDELARLVRGELAAADLLEAYGTRPPAVT